jgi:hypothetical protein
MWHVAVVDTYSVVNTPLTDVFIEHSSSHCLSHVRLADSTLWVGALWRNFLWGLH